MENGRDVDNNGGEVFPNRGVENGKELQVAQQRINEVKGILEYNKRLIEEIEKNQRAHEAGDCSVNAALALELHNNTARAMKLYSNISSAYSLSIVKGSTATPPPPKKARRV